MIQFTLIYSFRCSLKLCVRAKHQIYLLGEEVTKFKLFELFWFGSQKKFLLKKLFFAAEFRLSSTRTTSVVQKFEEKQQPESFQAERIRTSAYCRLGG